MAIPTDPIRALGTCDHCHSRPAVGISSPAGTPVVLSCGPCALSIGAVLTTPASDTEILTAALVRNVKLHLVVGGRATPSCAGRKHSHVVAVHLLVKSLPASIERAEYMAKMRSVITDDLADVVNGISEDYPDPEIDTEDLCERCTGALW